jgi:gas vesicle protein
MTDPNEKKEISETGFNPAIAAIIGATVGAGVAIAGATILADEKKRNKVKKVIDQVKTHAMDYVENLKKQTNEKKTEVKKQATKTIADSKQKIKKAVDSALEE